ncbi:DUF6199 family natural product biosynthesis protein [Uliginosibacterium sp. TH139]|uniref:DUF6199 family natural product biosynthesis protein n=1 Tax=Uliginosibacterium sp. TH139 TaxID=2067453 RepID=UPI000C7CFC76|nr:hypothetical protein C0V76_08410 [Uliginosibacterium sp. TH139]
MDKHQLSPQLFALFPIVMGLIGIFCPRFIFFINEGWKFRDAEPSDWFLLLTRLGGVMSVIFGLVIFFKG